MVELFEPELGGATGGGAGAGGAAGGAAAEGALVGPKGCSLGTVVQGWGKNRRGFSGTFRTTEK